jgi:hypothetical protein
VSGHLDVNWYGGWFVPVPSPDPSSVAFAASQACCSRKTGVITNAGGSWHVAPLG